MERKLIVRGAREHNLKNVSLEIPKDKLVVFTGVSGSGKSSLAFDTIYAEGQRRYVESLSSYARQFLGVMGKPAVDQIEGLSPSISIGQKQISNNPRSTVGTITEIYDFLRLLFARVGHPHCPQCGREIKNQSSQQITDQIVNLVRQQFQDSAIKKQGVRLMIMSPLIKDRKGEYSQLLEDLQHRGYTRVRVDHHFFPLDGDLVLIRTNRHTIEAVVDRLVVPVSEKNLSLRLSESVQKALSLGNGHLIVAIVKDQSFDFPEKPKELEEYLFSELFACPICNLSLPEMEPRSFSFNSPHGACSTCDGLGVKLEVDPERVFSPLLSVNEGGILPWSNVGEKDSWMGKILEAVARELHFSLDTALKELPEKILEVLLFGSGHQVFTVETFNRSGERREYETKFEGVVNHLERRYKETDSENVRNWIEKFMKESPCPDCQGQRLNPTALSVTIDQKNIAEVTAMSIFHFREWVEKTFLNKEKRGEEVISKQELEISAPIVKEILSRSKFLMDVGLQYLTLDRTGCSLSSGEAQRIRLASQIGSGLTGVLYVLDEPSIGLHYRDHHRLLQTLTHLRDLGNTIIVIEHDDQTIKIADWVVDFGPFAGDRGGEVIFSGPLSELLKAENSITGEYLSGKRLITRKNLRSELNPGEEVNQEILGKSLKIGGCQEHNLKNIDVSFPLGKFICVTGVSGSGKSTLIMDTLYKRLHSEFYQTIEVPGKHKYLEGLEYIQRVINIDQSPIGRTPRSNPATYTGAFTPIRELFAMTPEAKARGYGKGRFSFNVKNGRCENCQGDGSIKIEMQFLPDVYVDCEVCEGKRYNRETLEILFKGKNIAEVLDMDIDTALGFFRNVPSIRQILETLQKVGLGYLKLGQPAPTLSGGEAQRVKLAKELSKTPRGHTLYILDEPTTGLHSYDIEKLLKILHGLVMKGNTVLVIEHNMDVIKTADWIIDLGPEGGNQGGRIVAEGTVEDIIKSPISVTGEFLKPFVSE